MFSFTKKNYSGKKNHKKILRLENKDQEYNRLISACLTATTQKIEAILVGLKKKKTNINDFAWCKIS